MDGRKTPWPWYVAAAFCFAADRGFKQLALSGFSAGEGGPAAFTLFKNTGIAFSIPVSDAIFWPAAIVAMLLLLGAYARSVRLEPGVAGILFLIILGATSNLIDRVIYDATIDYLLFFKRSAVNLADGMIVGGLLWLALRDYLGKPDSAQRS